VICIPGKSYLNLPPVRNTLENLGLTDGTFCDSLCRVDNLQKVGNPDPESPLHNYNLKPLPDEILWIIASN